MFDINTPHIVSQVLFDAHEEMRDFRAFFYNYDFKEHQNHYVMHLVNKVVHVGSLLAIEEVEIPKRTRSLNQHIKADAVGKAEELYLKANEACRYTLPYLLNIHSKYPKLYEFELRACLPKQLSGDTYRTIEVKEAIEAFRPLYDYLLQQEVIKGLLA